MERKPNNNCGTCNAKIYVKPSVLIKSKSGKAFCSMDCYGKYYRKYIKCLVCETEILSGANKKTCSRSCANKHRNIMIKEGTIGRPLKDKVKKHDALRKRLIEHLEFEHCQICKYNKIPQVLQIHHVIERAQGGSDDLSNLQLLCPTCHSEEHYFRRMRKKQLKLGN